MTNQKRGSYYFNQVEEEYRQLQYYLAKCNWNMVIRKSQEVIELLLKGVLKFMNIEFPKEHDIGEYFEEILNLRKIEYDKMAMERMKVASKVLTEKRAPAYYGEVFYSQEEAEEAREQAEFARKFVKELMKRLEYEE